MKMAEITYENGIYTAPQMKQAYSDGAKAERELWKKTIESFIRQYQYTWIGNLTLAESMKRWMKEAGVEI